MASPGKQLQTVENALDVVDALQTLGGAGVTEVADHLDMAPSTVHSYLSTLTNRGFLVKEGDVYHIGLRFLHIGGDARRRKEAYELAIDHVDELVEQTQERAQFTVEEHGQEFFLHTNSGDRGVVVDARIGKRSEYLHTSATGKAILSELPRERVEAILDRKGMPALTDNTITDRDELFDELDRIKQRGYSLNREEEVEGVRAVGAPVMAPDSRILGALSVSGPTKRLRGELFESELPEQLMGAANELELKIAYP